MIKLNESEKNELMKKRWNEMDWYEIVEWIAQANLGFDVFWDFMEETISKCPEFLWNKILEANLEYEIAYEWLDLEDEVIQKKIRTKYLVEYLEREQ